MMQQTDDDTIVCRRLTLTDDCTAAEPALKAIAAVAGVTGITLDQPRITISYDMMQLALSDLIRELEARGITIKQSIWQRLYLSWHCFTEQNTRDNIRHQPHCCNKLPKQNK